MEFVGSGFTLDNFPSNFLHSNCSEIEYRTNVKQVLRGVFMGLKYLKECNICHRDIKPANIYISDDLRYVKIIDFNTAIALKDKNSTIGVAGDPFYQSPEMQRGCIYSNKTDIWSAGLVAFYLMSKGVLPEIKDL